MTGASGGGGMARTRPLTTQSSTLRSDQFIGFVNVNDRILLVRVIVDSPADKLAAGITGAPEIHRHFLTGPDKPLWDGLALVVGQSLIAALILN